MAESTLRRAASPEVTVSTRWPFLRSAISSISQMERVSSHTRMLAMCAPCLSLGHFSHLGGFLRRRLGLGIGARDLDGEFRAAALGGAHRNLGAMRLHNLINDGQPKTRAALEARL